MSNPNDPYNWGPSLGPGAGSGSGFPSANNNSGGYDPSQAIPLPPSHGSPQPPVGGPGGNGGQGGQPRGADLVVLSESSIPQTGRAGWVNGLRLLAFVFAFYAVWVSGAIGQIFRFALYEALDLFLPLILVMFVMLALLPAFVSSVIGAFTSVLGGAATAGAEAAVGGLRRRRSPVGPGLSLVCRTATGRSREVLVHAQAHVPAGSTIRVFGPTGLGRQHAWLVINRSLRQSFFARGVIPSILLTIVLVGAGIMLLSNGTH